MSTALVNVFVQSGISTSYNIVVFLGKDIYIYMHLSI